MHIIQIILRKIAMLVKIKKEEEFMNEVFGSSFQSYKAKVKRLIPGIYLKRIHLSVLL